MIRPPVLCYHRIGGPPELGITRVSPQAFARHMTALAKAGWRTVTLEQFIGSDSPYLFPVTRLSSAGRNFLLTFDDGYASLEHAYPVLADLGFTATTFLVTDYVGRENLWDVRYTRHRLTHLDWPVIEAWKARGFDFGSHSATHRRLTWLGEQALAEDLGRSRQTLVSRLGAAAGRAIAYPFGAANRRVVEVARRTGFEVGFAGVWEAGSDPLRLPRLPVYLWDVGRFPTALRGGVIGAVGRLAAHVANRSAIGTSIMLALAEELRGSKPGAAKSDSTL